MLSTLIALTIQTQQFQQFHILDETLGENAPVKGGVLVYTVEARIVGRKGKVFLDTRARALPYMLEQVEKPTNILEFAISGLGRRSERVVSEPDSGLLAFVRVVEIKRI